MCMKVRTKELLHLLSRHQRDLALEEMRADYVHWYTYIPIYTMCKWSYFYFCA